MGSLTMDRLLLAQLLICSLPAAAPQRNSFGGLSSFGSFGSGRSSSGWSSWSRSEVRSGTIRRLAPLSRGRDPTIDDALGLRQSAFDSFESAWLKGGRTTDDGFWYTGAQRKRVKNVDEEEEEEDYYDDYEQEGSTHSSGCAVPWPGRSRREGGSKGAKEGREKGQGDEEGCRPEDLIFHV